MQFQNKNYRRSDPVFYRGCFFHSLLELKYVLSIEQTYRFIRKPVKIGYDPATLRTTNYFRGNIKIYTPDLLIRPKRGGRALLVEIKPDFLKATKEMDVYNEVLKNYIIQTGLDWDHVVIYGSEVHLSVGQQRTFDLLRSHKQVFYNTLSFQHLDRKYNNGTVLYHSSIPAYPQDSLDKKAYADFVRYGIL